MKKFLNAHRRVVVFIAGVALGSLGCDSAERREAQSIVNAITRFRTADNASTPGAVRALKATPCSTPEICRAREVCLASGEATAKALELKADVEKQIARLEKGELAKDSDEAKALATKLDEAETMLKRGHEGLPDCDAEVVSLKRKHRI